MSQIANAIVCICSFFALPLLFLKNEAKKSLWGNLAVQKGQKEAQSITWAFQGGQAAGIQHPLCIFTKHRQLLHGIMCHRCMLTKVGTHKIKFFFT